MDLSVINGLVEGLKIHRNSGTKGMVDLCRVSGTTLPSEAPI